MVHMGSPTGKHTSHSREEDVVRFYGFAQQSNLMRLIITRAVTWMAYFED